MTDDERDAVLSAIDLYIEMHKWVIEEEMTVVRLHSARAEIAELSGAALSEPVAGGPAPPWFRRRRTRV